MVRLRTNRGYGSPVRQGRSFQAANSSNSSRRLISLCILLALVLVLIQRASDPRYVRNAFSALGVPLDDHQVDSHRELDALHLPTPNVSNPASESPLARTCRDLIPKVFGDANGIELRELSKRWFSRGVTSPGENVTSASLQLFRQANDKLSEVASSVSSAEPQWIEALDRFNEDFQLLESNLSEIKTVTEASEQAWRTKLSQEFTLVLNNFLDSFLLGTLRDASPWEPSESVGFWRLLQRTNETSSNSEDTASGDQPRIPLINTLQLESDRSVYRGSVVRYQGSVRRAQWIEKENPEFALASGYGVLWLRGSDRSRQPIAIYTTDELAKVLSSRELGDGDEFPEIELTGIVAKRLAYGSPAGVQVAPTIFASHLSLISGSTAETVAVPENFNIAWIILAASLLAVAILIPLFFGKGWRLTRRTRSSPMRQLLPMLLFGSLTFQVSAVLAIQNESEKSVSPSADDGLPWARDDADAKLATLLSERLQSVLDATAIADLQVKTSGDNPVAVPEAALKVMHTISQIGWSRALRLGKQIEFDQADCSLRVVELSGTARLAAPIALSSSQLAWFPYDKLYRIGVEFAEEQAAVGSTTGPPLLDVYCRTLPSNWLTSKQLRQSVSLQGLAIYPRLSPGNDSNLLPLCVLVDSPTWIIRPDADLASLQPDIKPEWRQLGQNGWNLTWADLVLARNQSKLANDEQEAFYSFLRVTSKLDWADQNIAEKPMQLLGKPRENLGQPLSWLVRIVQAAVVQVQDPQAVQTLGIDRYYQFDGFVDIGQQKIRYKVPVESENTTAYSSQANSDVIEFQGEFPITIVSVSPQLLTAEQLSSGVLSWQVRHYAQLDGFFYRIWSYHSELLESKGSQARQIAPLVVASSLTFANSPRPSNGHALGWFNVAIGVVLLGVLGLLGYYIMLPQRRRRGIRNAEF